MAPILVVLIALVPIAVGAVGFGAGRGLVHTLLGIDSRDTLVGHSAACASREGFVIENLPAAGATIPSLSKLASSLFP